MASRSRAVLRVPTCPAYAPVRSMHPLREPGAVRMLDRERLRGVGDRRGDRAEVEVRVVDTVDGPRAARATRVPAARGRSAPSRHRATVGAPHGGRRYPPTPGPPGFTTSAPIRASGDDAGCRISASGTVSRRRPAPVDRHRERAALEAVAAVGPRDVGVERGKRRARSWWWGSGPWSCVFGLVFAVRADPGADDRHASRPRARRSRRRASAAASCALRGDRLPVRADFARRARRRTNRARARSARRRPVRRRATRRAPARGRACAARARRRACGPSRGAPRRPPRRGGTGGRARAAHRARDRRRPGVGTAAASLP